MFLDETAINTKMARHYGWAPRGERCRVAVPFGHWKTIPVTAGLRAGGLTATALFDGPMTGARLCCYVEETLAPTLKQGDMVVLDTLPAHKVAGIRERIEAAGVRLLYLPAYSPDFNPTDLAFAKLKPSLRAQAARTVADLCDTIKQAFRRFTPDECRNYLMAAGYNAFNPARSDAALEMFGPAVRRCQGLRIIPKLNSILTITGSPTRRAARASRESLG